MSNWGFGSSSRVESIGVVTSTTSGTTLVMSDTSTKSGWVELSSGVPFTAGMIEILSWYSTDVLGWGWLDFAFGGVGNERVVISDFLMQSGGSVLGRTRLPLLVPAGTRVSVRGHTGGFAPSVNITLRLIPLSWYQSTPPTRWVGVRGDGLWFDPGGSVALGDNAMGGWGEMTASSPLPITNIAVPVGLGGGGGTRSTYRVEIGVGASGSERVIASPGVLSSSFWNNSGVGQDSWPVPYISSGTRISIRGASNNSSSSARFALLLGG